MQPQFSPQSQGVVARAKQIAHEQGSGVAGEAHLFLSLLDTPEADDDLLSPLLLRSGVSRHEARLYAQSAVVNIAPKAGEAPKLSRGARNILHHAAMWTRFSFDSIRRIEPHHILISCVEPRHRRNSTLVKVLRSLGLNAPKLHRDLHDLKLQQARNPLAGFSPRALLSVEAAHAAMRASFCGKISAAHLLLGLLTDTETASRLETAGCDLEGLQKRGRDSIRSDGQIATHEKRFSPGAKRALERAARAAQAAGHRHIDCDDLLSGLLPARKTLGEKWRARGRELDSVDGLWSVEEACALLGRVHKLPNPLLRELVASESQLELLRFAFPISVFVSAVCNILMCLPGELRWIGVPSALLFLGALVFSALGLSITGLLFRTFSPRTKIVWAKILVGLIVGFFVGNVLADAIGIGPNSR